MMFKIVLYRMVLTKQGQDDKIPPILTKIDDDPDLPE